MKEASRRKSTDGAKAKAKATPRLTAAYLRTLGACSNHVDRFESRWPRGVAVTAAWVRAAWADNLDVTWLCVRLERPDLWNTVKRAINRFRRAEAKYDYAIRTYTGPTAKHGHIIDEFHRSRTALGRADAEFYNARVDYVDATPLACARLIRKHLREGGAR